jgi:hypothetical protein
VLRARSLLDDFDRTSSRTRFNEVVWAALSFALVVVLRLEFLVWLTGLGTAVASVAAVVRWRREQGMLAGGSSKADGVLLSSSDLATVPKRLLIVNAACLGVGIFLGDVLVISAFAVGCIFPAVALLSASEKG